LIILVLIRNFVLIEASQCRCFKTKPNRLNNQARINTDKQRHSSIFIRGIHSCIRQIVHSCSHSFTWSEFR